LYDLAAEVIHGTASEAQLARLEEELRCDTEARSAYLHYALLHAQLHLTDAALIARAAVPSPTGSRTWNRRWTLWTAAAAACFIALLVGGLALRRDRGDGAVASLVEARDLVWAAAQAPIGAGTRLKPQHIRWVAGTLKLTFDSGALITLEGPADLQVLSSMHIRAARGRITARVEGGVKGFSIETPSTLVVDQGTEFGLEVDDSGQTGVVVFKGLVDLSWPGSAQSPASILRLGQGEGMRVGRTGRMSRIVSVERLADADAWSIGPTADRDVVIRSVRDNIRGLGSSKYYEIVHRGLIDGKPAYVDRVYQWKGLGPDGLPGFLGGADYIMPFNDDKRAKDLQVTVDLGPAATLYIFFDDRQAIPPWLSGRFTDTGMNIGLDVMATPNPDAPTELFSFSVWKRDLEPGATISLGAIDVGNFTAMYGIAAVPRP
jgi:hypothetical protein